MKSNIQTCLVMSIYCLWIDEFHAFCHVSQPGATKINMVNLARSGLVTQVSISLEVFLGDFHFRAKSKYSWNSRPIDPLACWQKVEIIPMLECWIERKWYPYSSSKVQLVSRIFKVTLKVVLDVLLKQEYLWLRTGKLRLSKLRVMLIHTNSL